MAVVERALGLARGGAGAVASKGGRDIVTAADVAVEDAVRELLTGAVGLAVIGEERGGETPGPRAAYWLVDPICGTRNFASGIPLYCVNLALVEGGQVAVAVVGDPSTGEIAVAERGGGAWALRDGRARSLRARDESRGSLLASEAGAILTDLEGRPWTIQSDSLLISAKKRLHADLLAMARTAAPGPA